MTKIERVMRELSDLHDFQRRLERWKRDASWSSPPEPPQPAPLTHIAATHIAATEFAPQPAPAGEERD